MRTTLDISDDVLDAARAIARERGVSLGLVMSELARAGLQEPEPPRYRDGIKLLPIKRPAAPVTLELINELRDEYP
jgi:hypothetical protein